MQEQQQYGGYTGSPQYDGPPVQQPYNTPPQDQNVPPVYDDAFMDAFAQRLSQRMAQGPQGKVYPQGTWKDRASAGQRLALAITSIVMLIPIGGVVAAIVSAAGGFWIAIAGLLTFGIAAAVVLLINVVFNQNG